ncbi:Rho guanine nucleotide exchange factor 16 [Echinococcus granulosus]|uniref:Rho guanine nucleotide exchange factor 16 n=1 Tax=Echinococcus granulosus TaxID=6210 RepID=A0A068WNV2_ECHGR|nr:Rho guanine nucleotide exchange factor 16 [Echinococcus granulosus]CDS20174.1 rho guanine nucleotide exchange factor 16 [Echinococcus granulosus]
MVVHISCGKKRPKKKGLFYFLCCGCGTEDDSQFIHKTSGEPLRPFRQPSNNLPSDIADPSNLPSRPSPPNYFNEPCASVEERRKHFEEVSERHPGRPPILFQRPSVGGSVYTNGSFSAKSFFAKSLVAEEDELQGNGDRKKVILRLEDAEKKYDNRLSFKSIFGNAPLYQIYDEHFKRKEIRRLHHRLRESIRSLRRKRGDQRPLRQPKAIVSPPKFGPDDQSSSSSSSGDEDELKTPSSAKASSFTVIKRDLSRRRSDVERTAKMGEMNSVANEFSGTGPSRVRWSDMLEVVRLNLAAGLTKEQRSLQEARFEIITSEASYYKSLTVLIDLFYKAPVFNPIAANAVITEFDKHQLFSNILNIHVTSENLLHSLETSFRKDPMMGNICDILYEHSETKLSYYVTYVKNQMYQTRTLSKLMNRPSFKEAVQNIQSMPQCSGLDLNSFLVLPMQRVMRLRLLVAAVIHYTPRSLSAYESGLVALASLEKLIAECNSQKGHMEQKERLVTLSSQLEFKSNLRAVGTGSRELVKEGNLRLLESSNLPNAAFRRKFSETIKNKPIQITLFLFTDILLVAKRKGEKYLVEDISPVDDLRVTIEALPEDDMIKRTELKTKINPDDPFHIVPNIRPDRSISVRQSGELMITRQGSHFRERSRSRGGSSRHRTGAGATGVTSSSSIGSVGGFSEGGVSYIGYPFILTFQSTDFTIVDYHFLCDTLSQRERWVDALQPDYYSVPSEISYDTWDCPQVIAIVSYGATERDELDLKEGDLMNVIVELSDGWLKGVLPDGRAGWVPKSVCQHVEDPQARRQNMKNFLLSEEAQRAYQKRKQQEKRVDMFVRVHDLRGTSV